MIQTFARERDVVPENWQHLLDVVPDTFSMHYWPPEENNGEAMLQFDYQDGDNPAFFLTVIDAPVDEEEVVKCFAGATSTSRDDVLLSKAAERLKELVPRVMADYNRMIAPSEE